MNKVARIILAISCFVVFESVHAQLPQSLVRKISVFKATQCQEGFWSWCGRIGFENSADRNRCFYMLPQEIHNELKNIMPFDSRAKSSSVFMELARIKNSVKREKKYKQYRGNPKKKLPQRTLEWFDIAFRSSTPLNKQEMDNRIALVHAIQAEDGKAIVLASAKPLRPQDLGVALN